MAKLQGDHQPLTFTEVRGGANSSAEKFWKPQLNPKHGPGWASRTQDPGATLQTPEMTPSSPPLLAQKKQDGLAGAYFLQLVPQGHHPALQTSGICWAKEMSSGWDRSHRLDRVKLHLQHGTAGNGGRVGLKSSSRSTSDSVSPSLHKGANLEKTLLLYFKFLEYFQDTVEDGW